MNKYITVDSGTTNTRVSLVCGGKVTDCEKFNMGARACADDRELFEKTLSVAIKDVLLRNSLCEGDVEKILASGMITSEMGLCPLEHIKIPAGIKELKNSMKEVLFENISTVPFVFVRGVKKEGETFEEFDVMRGEESELMGSERGEGECVYMLMGSHSKIIKTDAEGKIIDFCTMLTGEMGESVAKGTILKNSLILGEELDKEALKKGYEFCKENGMSQAFFKVRVLKNFMNKSDKEVYSFYMGALLCGECEYILRKNPPSVVVGGNRHLKDALYILLCEYARSNVRKMTEEEVDFSTSAGLVKIYES